MYEGLKPCPHRTVDNGGRILCGLIKNGDREVSVNLCRACPVPQINCQHLRATMDKKVSTPITVRYATGRVEVWDDEPPTIGFKHAACSAKTMPINSPRDCAGCQLHLPNFVPQNAIQVAREAKAAYTANAVAAAQPPPPRAAKPIVEEIPMGIAAEPVAESVAAQEMAKRAQSIAAKKLRESSEVERAQYVANAKQKGARPAAAPAENKSKIILLQQWLADQFNKKVAAEAAAANEPDEDGVQEITYSPLAPSYQEDSGMERCVGWTD
jgi:hypothetical protein